MQLTTGKRVAAGILLAAGLSLAAAGPTGAGTCAGLVALDAVCTTPSDPAVQPAPAPAPVPAPAPAPAPARTLTEMPEGASRLVELVNRDRAGAGVGPLTARADVTAIASGHSRNMADRERIWHNDAYFSPATGSRLGARFRGENVAVNMSIDDAHRRLMASPHHRENILDGRFSVVGMAVWQGRNGAYYVTQDFLQPAAAAAPAVPPTPTRPGAATPTGPAGPVPSPAPAAAAPPAQAEAAPVATPPTPLPATGPAADGAAFRAAVVTTPRPGLPALVAAGLVVVLCLAGLADARRRRTLA